MCNWGWKLKLDWPRRDFVSFAVEDPKPLLCCCELLTEEELTNNTNFTEKSNDNFGGIDFDDI